MAFINEDERTPYGTLVLRRETGLGTVDKMIKAVQALNGEAGGQAFIWIMGKERPVGFRSALAGPDGIVIDTTPSGQMPPPMPGTVFVRGMQAEARKAKDGAASAVFIKFDGEDRPRAVEAARLECFDDGSSQPLYAVTFETGEETEAASTKDAEAEPPSDGGGIRRGLAALARASGRQQIGKEPLVCRIPSVSSRYIDDEEIAAQAGTTCVVDSVLRRGQHIELELMSLSPEDCLNMQFDAGDQAADAVAGKCERLGGSLPLFFMYKGEPYAATEFKIEGGFPPELILEPWADVDERDDSDRIRAEAAAASAAGIL